MKKECLNKNFLPNIVVEKINSNKRKEEKIRFYVLVSIFLFLFPKAMDKLEVKADKPKKRIVTNNINKGIPVSEVDSWFKLYFNGLSGDFNKNEGNIIVCNEENIEKICNEKNYKIKKIESSNDNTYKVTLVKK